nr:GntR family transcriptional regulator [Rhodococcus sp. (in: high G+C Gram-positive bacteria)]
MTVGVKKTRSEVVYDEVRAEILNGEISPGVRLKIADLGARFGVSLSVVREALTRLGEQGLVVSNPQRGFNVVDVSADDLQDITYVRIQIETMALKDSIEHGGVAWESLVVSAHHTLERTPLHLPDGRVNGQWLEVHRAFHQALLEGCGSPRLQSIANSLRDGAELYRVWSGTLAHDKRDLAGEHRAIMEAALAGEVDSAQQRLAEHIGRTTEALLSCSRIDVPPIT